MNPAETLSQVINVFDPLEPLKGEALDAFYVERNGSPLKRMMIELMAAREARDKSIKLLFTGHKGSGKTTELNKLSTELRHLFFIVPVAMRELAPLSDLTYVDIILAMATALIKEASDRNVIRQAPAQVVVDLWTDLQLFLEKTILGGLSFKAPPAADEVSVKVNLLAVEFQAKFKSEGATRDDVRKRMENRLSEVIEKINTLSDEVRAKYKRPVLFIIEDTDKPDLARAKDIFFNHGRTLSDFLAFAIYTFPIGLRYTREFNDAKANFNSHPLLPNLKLINHTGERNSDGEHQMVEIVRRRIAAPLIDNAAIDDMVTASGGLTRILIRLVRTAAVNAYARNAPTIEPEDARYAINQERGDFIAALRSDDYPVLALRHADKQLNADNSTQELLQSLALLEYANDEPWCDVQPIVLPIMLERVKQAKP